MEYKKIVIGKYTLNEDGTVTCGEWTSPKESPLRWDGENFVIAPNANWVNPEIVVAILNSIMDKARSLSWIESQLLSDEEASLISTVLSIANVLGVENFDPNSNDTIRSMVSTCTDGISDKGAIMNKLNAIEEDTTETNRQLSSTGEVGSALSELSNNDESMSGKIDSLIDELDADKEESFANKVNVQLTAVSGSLDAKEEDSFASAVLGNLNDLKLDLDESTESSFAQLVSKNFDSLSETLDVETEGSFANKVNSAMSSVVIALDANDEDSVISNVISLLNAISSSLNPMEQGSFAKVVTDKLVAIYTQLDVTQRSSFAKAVTDALNKELSGSIAKELTEAVAAIKATLDTTGDRGALVNWLSTEFNSIVLPSSTLLAIADAVSTNCSGKLLSNANYVEMERALRGMSVNLTEEAKSNIISWMEQNLASSYAKWVELASQYSNQELEFANANNALGAQLSSLQKILSDVAGINQSLNSLGGWTGSIEQASNRLLQTKDQLIEVSGNFCTLLNNTVDSNLTQLKDNLESSVNQFIADIAKNQTNFQNSELAIKTKELEIKNAELSLKKNEFEYSKVQQQDLKEYRDGKLKAMNDAMMSEVITRAVEAVQRQFNASRDEQIKIAQLSKPSL